MEESISDLVDITLQRSSSVEEFIGNRPSFIVRWGNTFLLLAILIIILVSLFVQYPEFVRAKGYLQCINSPKEVIAHSQGKIAQLNVKEKESVVKGEILGYLESLASPEEIRRLESDVDTVYKLITNNQTDKIVNFFPSNVYQGSFKNLGELQTNYQTFIQSFISFKDYLNTGIFFKKKKLLLLDINNIEKLEKILLYQKELIERDLSLTDENFSANSKLIKEKIISASDFRNEESKLISKKMSLPQINTSLISNNNLLNEKQKQIAELENQIIIQKNNFIQSLLTLKSQIQSWNYKYLLTAPISGTVLFKSFLQQNQEVKSDQSLLSIDPGDTNYFLELVIPQFNFGKIREGQKVLLKFPSYPSEQFGTVDGTIEFISPISVDSGFLAKVKLPQGLLTSYNKKIVPKIGLSADVNIIIENLNLLQRFYLNIKKQLIR